MSERDGEPPSVDVRLFVPPQHEAGTYANFLVVWHTAYEFTLDFAVTLPVQRVEELDLDSPLVMPCRVVSRVKIPVTLIFDVLQALNATMTRYEARYGEIERPERREDG